MRSQRLDARGTAGQLRLVVFLLDGQRYGLDLAATDRVLPMVAVSSLPGCPDLVLGAINVHGDVIPVLDVRRRLGLPPIDYGPTARLLVAHTARRTVALPADEVTGLADVAVENVVPPHAVLPEIDGVSGIAAVADGLVLIHDLETFLSIDEERQLESALGGGHA